MSTTNGTTGTTGGSGSTKRVTGKKAGHARTLRTEMSETACSNLEVYIHWLVRSFDGQEALAALLNQHIPENERTNLQPAISRWCSGSGSLPSPMFFPVLATVGGFAEGSLRRMLEEPDFEARLSEISMKSTVVELKISKASLPQLAKWMNAIAARIQECDHPVVTTMPETEVLSITDLERLRKSIQLATVMSGLSPDDWLASLKVDGDLIGVEARDIIIFLAAGNKPTQIEVKMSVLDELAKAFPVASGWNELNPTRLPLAPLQTGRQLIEALRSAP